MILNEIEIKDFKCFEHFKCTFAPGMNVLIGRNGAGKTTLIHAIHKALSFIFSNDRSLGKEFLSQGNNTLNVRGFKEDDYRFDFNTREPVKDAWIRAKADYNHHHLDWKLYRRNQTNAALYQSNYKVAYAKFMHQWKVEGAPLPLLAYYSDSYPHKDVKTMTQALEKVNKEIMPRNFGYYQWDEDKTCTSLWEIRMCNCMNRVQPLNELLMAAEAAGNNEDAENYRRQMAAPKAEMEYVGERLKSFAASLPGIKENNKEIIFFSTAATKNELRLRLHFKDGSFSLLQDLPAGYRRLYSIVFDMAYRAYILNEAKEPEGVVVIDEVDLHLHPSLEQVVVDRLAKTFSKVQFIVSSHSAAVISNIEQVKNEEGKSVNKILAMSEHHDAPEELPDIYGIDYSEALRDFMDTPSRNTELKVLRDLYLTYVGHNLKEEAQTIYEKIAAKVGENSPVIQQLKEEAARYEIH